MGRTCKEKVRKRRKPMSEEQRAAAAERLAIARRKKVAKNPPKYKNVHPSVLAKPDDHTFSFEECPTVDKDTKRIVEET